MKAVILALALTVTVAQQAEVVCRVGSWSGTLAQVAEIEAVHQAREAQQDGRAYPQGAPEQSLWATGLLRCERT